MAAIITDQIRILNAGNFVSGVQTSTNAYYSFIGLPNETEIQTDWKADHPSPKKKIDDEKNIEDITFEGSGCAISIASASIMTDLLKNKKEKEVKEVVEDFLEMIKEKPELSTKILLEDEKMKLMCLSGVKQYPMRVKCATLSWHTLVSAFDNKREEVKTEN